MTFLLQFILYLSICMSSEYNGPTDEAGDPSAVRSARMNGNRVLLYFGDLDNKYINKLNNFAKSKNIKFISSPHIYQLIKKYNEYKDICINDIQEKSSWREG